MPLLAALIGFLLHLAIVVLVLHIMETYWPALHRMLRAFIISGIVAFLILLFHDWLCGWLCRVP